MAAAGEAVVAVKAAALNFFDTLIIAGKYQHKPPFPFSPAAEFAGVVESVGAGVTAVKPGDRVMGYPGFGAAREKLAIAADGLIKLPDGLDFERASGLTVTYGTSYHALKDRADLKPGETLAVLGASGGVGLAAVELGKLMGARVIACASSDEKLAFAKQHGADDSHQLFAGQSARCAARRHRRQGRRRGLRPCGRAVLGAGGARSQLGRAPAGRRLCGRRDSENPAQSHAAEELRHPRRVLGRVDAAQSGGAPRQHDAS